VSRHNNQEKVDFMQMIIDFLQKPILTTLVLNGAIL